MQRNNHAFTLLELAVVIVLVLIVVAVFVMPMRPPPRRTVRIVRNSSQIRGVITGLISYSSSNKGRYPGLGQPDANGDGFLDSAMPPLQDGTDTGLTEGNAVQARYYELLRKNLFTGDLIINPFEAKDVWTTGGVDTKHYSYAMLHIGKDAPAQRAAEWRNTVNASAVVISDRNIALEQGNHETDPAFAQSPQSNKPGQWEGNAGFNDNHVEVLTEPFWETKYGVTRIKDDSRNQYAEFDAGGDYFFAAGETDEDGQSIGDFDTGNGAVMVYDDTSVGTTKP